MLRVLADEAIPLVPELFGHFAHVQTLPYGQIDNQSLQSVDILLVRSVTPVHATLLKHTSVQWVGTVTTGIDHLDINWLEQHAISWASAKGANASAVSEYVIACIAWLQQQGHLPHTPFTAGIIGAGHIGSRMVRFLQDIGSTVLVYDPPRAAREPDFISTPLDQWQECDLISVHVPLVKTGPDSTVHIIDNALLNRQPHCAFINTARGEVIDAQTLLTHPEVIACLDVWPHEPHVDPTLLQHATIATPHIAGYGATAKIQASVMIYEQCTRFFNIPHPDSPPPLPLLSYTTLDTACCKTWQDVVLQAYNPHTDTSLFQKTGDFTHLRQTYTLRKPYEFMRLGYAPHLSYADQIVLSKIGFYFKQLIIA